MGLYLSQNCLDHPGNQITRVTLLMVHYTLKKNRKNISEVRLEVNVEKIKHMFVSYQRT